MMTEAGDDRRLNDGRGGSSVFEKKSTRAVPSEAGERGFFFCLCVSSVRALRKGTRGLCCAGTRADT